MIRRIVILATAVMYALAFMLFILSMAAWYANELNRPRAAPPIPDEPTALCCDERYGKLIPAQYGNDC
jgi:hypothetical protein